MSFNQAGLDEISFLKPISNGNHMMRVWLAFADVIATTGAVISWFCGYFQLGCFLWLLSELWAIQRKQYLMMGDNE